MPIYEYVCKACQHQFEALVLRGQAPACEACGAVDLERLLSRPVVKSEATRAQSARAAKKRDQVQATERVNEQIRYERSHND